MKILNEKPPIWDEAKKHFEIDDSCAIFTYGDTIYNPAGVEIDPSFIAHEEVHGVQQSKYPGGPEEWWKRYFVDSVFRLAQEVEAYGKQYRWICQKYPGHKHWSMRLKYLNHITDDLAGPTYKIAIDLYMAQQLILVYAQR